MGHGIGCWLDGHMPADSNKYHTNVPVVVNDYR